MATVTFLVPTDMSQLTFPTNLSGATATEITVSDAQNSDVFIGNFTYSGTDAFGTVTSIEAFKSSALVANITGLNIDIHTAEQLIASNQVSAVLSLGLSGNNIINGSSGSDVLVDYGGNNIFQPNGGYDTIRGGAGFDQVVVHASLSGSTISTTGGLTTVTSAEGVDTISSVQRIQFDDGVLAFDIQQGGSAGDVYRLYQAAFDRTPDTGGLSFWVHAADTGVSIQTIAQGFTNSAEFQGLYGGTHPSPTTVIDLLYNHVLGRNPDDAGLNFWLNTMNNGTSVAEVLEGFAVSSENHGLVDAKIAQGIVLDHTAFLV